MKSKLKYIIVIFISILIAIIAFITPKLYFVLYDKEVINKYEINKLSFKNIDDTYKLSNDELIEILTGNDTKVIDVESEIDEKLYLELMNIFIEELGKINKSASNLFKNKYSLEFDDIEYINYVDIYAYTKKQELYPLKIIEIASNNIFIHVLFDGNNNTILSFNAENYNETNESYDKNYIELSDDYIKYLNCSLKKEAVDAYIDGNSIVLNPLEYNQITEYNIEGDY